MASRIYETFLCVRRGKPEWAVVTGNEKYVFVYVSEKRGFYFFNRGIKRDT